MLKSIDWVLAASILIGACGDGTAERADLASQETVDAVPEALADSSEGHETTAPETLDDTEKDDTAEVAPAGPRLRFLIDERPHDDGDEPVAATTARWGDPIRIVVDGLPPGATVTFAFSAAAGQSEAMFTAGADGVVDLGRDAPLAGSDWEVAHADGFLWSMRDALGPFDPKVRVWAWVDGDEVASGELLRHHTDADITTQPVASGTTRGLFALPPGDGPFGGVLCFGGSEGGTTSGEFCARYFASLGYAALGVGYFGAEGLPETLAEVPLEILEGDLAWLTADPRVAPGGIVVIGGSRGGELALLLGARFPVIAGVVAQVPSGLVWPSLSGELAAWTWAGVPLPYVPSSGEFARPAISSEGLRGFATANIFTASVAAAPPEALLAATIPAELTDGPVLLLAGADDQVWPACPLAEVSWLRLVEHGHDLRHGDRFLCHADAGHMTAGAPGGTSVGSTALLHPVLEVMLVTGGTVAGNGMARRANDSAVRALLEQVLGPGRITAPSSR